MRAIALALASGVGIGAPPDAAPLAASSRLYTVDRPAGRTLRGDFEVPDTVSLVYDETWHGMLVLIAAHVSASGARPMVIFDPSETGRVEPWLAEFSEPVGARMRRLVAPVDSVWIRDWGPIQTWDRQGRPLFLDAPYSDDRVADDEVPLAMAARFKLETESVPWALDGGALASNGAGLCVSTRDFFELWEIDVESAMLRDLGCAHLVLVPSLYAEETRHVDLELQFLSRDRVVVQSVDAETDPVNAARLDAVAEALGAVAAATGRTMEIHRAPMRPPAGGLADAYVNGIRLADRYLMPTFGDPEMDAAAHAAMQAAMPDVTVVGVDVRPLAGLGGAIHCMALTMNTKRRAPSRTRRKT